MEKFCEECQKKVETKIVKKLEEYIVYGEKITVNADVMVCSVCNEEMFNEQLDNETLTKAYDLYRQKHKLLRSEEIKQIREIYGLSQRGFAKLLNWGDKTIFRYENGSLQDKVHNSLLSLLKNPSNMLEYIEHNEIGLDETQIDKLRMRILELIFNKGNNSEHEMIINNYFSYEPSINSGFKTFDYDKLCSVILYFADKCDNLLKVKLMKLLNYSDMIFYKENGVSITGTQYVHLPFGPVPQYYDVIFGIMEKENIIHINIQFENGYEKHQVIPDCHYCCGLLTKKEEEVLERINKKFSGYGSAEISNYSHKEEGYKETKQGEVISYDYAKKIILA